MNQIIIYHYAVATGVFFVISILIYFFLILPVNKKLLIESSEHKHTLNRLHEIKAENENLVAKLDILQGKIISQQSVIIEQKTRLSEEKKHLEEKISFLNNVKSEMTERFKSLANIIFEEKGRSISENNLKELKNIINPFELQIERFKQKVEAVYVNGVKEQSSLKKEIENLYRLNNRLNKEAENLTRALKGDNKVQGQWGEMILEKILELSGLRKGIEYESQPGFRDNANKLFKPDIVVYLPGKRDVIIDSKVSLFDYEKYSSATKKDEQDYYLKKHIKAIKNHIKNLSSKDYSSLEGINSLDFIIMFIPIEGAFAAGFQNDPGLYDYSYKNKIVVTSPTTVLATLKTVEAIWKIENQNRNTIMIAEKASAVYDKFRGFVEDMEKLGRQLNTVNATYEDSYKKLSSGRGNLVEQANEFVELGVKVRKKIKIS